MAEQVKVGVMCAKYGMILILLFVMVASQTMPTVAQDDYGSGVSEGSNNYDSVDLYDFVRQSEECQSRFVNYTLHDGNDLACDAEFDFLMCWPKTGAGDTVTMQCPDIVDHYGTTTVSRECYANGTWSYLDAEKVYFEESICYCEHCKPILVINMLGYSISLLACIVASIIFLISKSLWCTRNLIHWHLITSFMIKYIIFIIMAIVGTEDRPIWVSRLLDSMFWYAEMTNYFWMFVEGLFLHTLVVFALKIDADRINFWIYCSIGWGQPLVFVGIWATINKIKYPADSQFIVSADSIPPHEYACIIGPILLVLLVNCIFLLNIVRVLMSKLRDGGGYGGHGGDLEQYRRAAKATLVLVVLLGVTYIIFICLPLLESYLSPRGNVTLVYVNAILASTQGLAVATIYVFCNREVRSLLRRKFRRRCSGIPFPCCDRGGMSTRRSSYRYDQTMTSTVMSVTTTDAWDSPVAKKRADGGPKMLPLVEESEGDSDKKETIELENVNVNNGAITPKEKNAEKLEAKDEGEPFLISGQLQSTISSDQQQVH